MKSPKPSAVAFGKALAQLRRAKGLTQADMVGRLGTYYSDETSYGRIEQGKRSPDRPTAVAIAIRGLRLTDAESINRLLGLAGFDGLTREEAQSLKLEWSEVPGLTVKPEDGEPIPRWAWPVAVASFVVSGILGLWISSHVPNHIGIALVTSVLYGSLFSVSLLLETAYFPDRNRFFPTAVILFSLMFVSSVAILAFGATMLRAGSPWSLAASFGGFLLTGMIQWLVLRMVLPGFSLQIARFQLMPAQVAHLKNTAYLLLLVILFWLPPFSAVLGLEREAETGNLQFVRGILDRQVMIGRGIVGVNAATLAGVWVLVVLVSIPMGARLLENMRPHPRLNVFYTLFYLRAILYFTLSLICVGWYFYSLGQWN